MAVKHLIRFDWAIKKLLRDKANFAILEGFLSELLREDVIIREILDSETNKERENDKHNRVDILVENSKKELVIVEVQNSKEYDYFHRILYGTSKVIAEHIQEGDPYSFVRKVISVTIAYFDLGQGEDYVYHGTNIFKGIHKGDILALSNRQKELYRQTEVHHIYPEYWIIKVSQFEGSVQDKLDEWIYFLKNSEVKSDFSAKGLKEAGEKLDKLRMTEEERKEYQRYLRHLMDVASAQYTLMIDAKDKLAMEQLKESLLGQGRMEGIQQGIQEGIQQGKESQQRETVLKLYRKGQIPEMIAELLDINISTILKIIEKA
jgi:predicted transposase/invertase (TIGR01784 family)